MEVKTQAECSQNWYKITIPNGVKYEKTWLMDLLWNHCRIPFTPVDFRYVRYHAQFYVQNVHVAIAMEDINCKIFDEDNEMIVIFVSPSSEPLCLQNKLKPEEMDLLKLTMYKRYDSSQQCLDLYALRFDPDLVNNEIHVLLNQRSYMAATLQIIEEHFSDLLSLNLCNNQLYRLDGLSDIVQIVPTIKSLNLSKNMLISLEELKKLKGLMLEELWLDENPLVDIFPDQDTIVSATRACFPTLLRLNGQELLPSTATDSEIPEIIKLCKESYKGSETIKNLVLQFLLQYYLIYDHGDRQNLLSVYYNEACFSLSIPFNPEDPTLSSLQDYVKYSRNLKILRNPDLQIQLLKNTNYDIVESLCMLPKTQHDLNSYEVDLCFQTETMIYFSVNGVFKEVKNCPCLAPIRVLLHEYPASYLLSVEGNFQGSIRTFTRIFILMPDGDSTLYIVNDELILRDIRTNIIQSTPTPRWMPILSEWHQKLVLAFATECGMNLQWSQKCLEDNEWNYTKAFEIFTMLKNEGKILEEIFTPSF